MDEAIPKGQGNPQGVQARGRGGARALCAARQGSAAEGKCRGGNSEGGGRTGGKASVAKRPSTGERVIKGTRARTRALTREREQARAGVGARRSLGRSRPRRLVIEFNLILDKGFLRKLKKFSYISPYCVGLKKVS